MSWETGFQLGNVAGGANWTFQVDWEEGWDRSARSRVEVVGRARTFLSSAMLLVLTVCGGRARAVVCARATSAQR